MDFRNVKFEGKKDNGGPWCYLANDEDILAVGKTWDYCNVIESCPDNEKESSDADPGIEFLWFGPLLANPGKIIQIARPSLSAFSGKKVQSIASNYIYFCGLDFFFGNRARLRPRIFTDKGQEKRLYFS